MIEGDWTTSIIQIIVGANPILKTFISSLYRNFYAEKLLDEIKTWKFKNG